MSSTTYTLKIGYKRAEDEDGNTGESTEEFTSLDAKEVKALMEQLKTQLDGQDAFVRVEIDESKEVNYAAFMVRKADFLFAKVEAEE